MSNILKTVKEQLHTLSMTDDERADIRLQISSHMHTYQPKHRVPSPYMFGVWQKRLSVMTAAFLIVMVTGGSSLAYASTAALPGDTLYSMKVNGVEEVQAAIQTSHQARAEFEVKRVEKRLGEAVTLAAQGKLDEKKKESITENLSRHTKKVSEETTKLIEENPDTAVEVSAKLALSLQAHSEAIGVAQDQNKVDGELDSIIEQVDAAQKTAEVEQAAATEILVANGEAALTVEDLTAKKDRLVKSYIESFGENVPAAQATETVSTEAAKMIVAPTAIAIAEQLSSSTDATLTATPTLKEQIDILFVQADGFIAAGNNTEAFLTLQKAEEFLLKIKLTDEVAKNLEAVATVSTETPAPAEPAVTEHSNQGTTTPVETPVDTTNQPADTTTIDTGISIELVTPSTPKGR